jgi:hypothetical protein
MARTRTEGLKAYRAKLLNRLPDAAKAEMQRANERTADDFLATVKRIIPRGDPKDGNLADTLEKRAGDPEFGGLGVAVSVGGPGHPYPLSLEAGHKAPDGSHVPGKPFWNPAKRLAAKRHKGRASRAQSKAIKSVIGGG